jgi:hypothetical protein
VKISHTIVASLRFCDTANDFKVVLDNVNESHVGAVNGKLQGLTRKTTANVNDSPEMFSSISATNDAFCSQHSEDKPAAEY